MLCRLTFSDKPTPWQRKDDFKKISKISGDTSSRKALYWTQKQLWNCLNRHDLCPPQQESALPMRILDLRYATRRPRNPAQDVKLYETRNENARYVCLSHCWGSANTIYTLSSNLETYRNNIPWHSLPKTFQDAITFTRGLQIRYLWIDSLCTIQDDIDD
jgi:hypothetical protein